MFIVFFIILCCCLATILKKSCTNRLNVPEPQNQEAMEMEQIQGDDNPEDIVIQNGGMDRE